MNSCLPIVLVQENQKYAKYKNFDCSEIYDTYGKLFGYTGDSTKYAVSPTKLSQRGLEFSTDSDREYGGDAVPINVEGTDSSASPDEGNREGRRNRTVPMRFSVSLEQMVSVGTDLASIARSYQKDVMSVVDCVKELLSSGHVQKGGKIHLFALWFLRDKDNRKSYATAETPYLHFKFVEYCFEREKMSLPRHV
ncbi:unnamed protein product [Fraxinus pennsylvanica]|uniref:Uncharacterized protein n=1 Tax=Fraxinus pennsylvanica TaxID=56036 RepID=A0AAD1YNB8_9LAMI|nr:unnamed protein product [Fraxinus pennsylvanica]